MPVLGELCQALKKNLMKNRPGGGLMNPDSLGAAGMRGPGRSSVTVKGEGAFWAQGQSPGQLLCFQNWGCIPVAPRGDALPVSLPPAHGTTCPLRREDCGSGTTEAFPQHRPLLTPAAATLSRPESVRVGTRRAAWESRGRRARPLDTANLWPCLGPAVSQRKRGPFPGSSGPRPRDVAQACDGIGIHGECLVGSSGQNTACPASGLPPSSARLT